MLNQFLPGFLKKTINPKLLDFPQVVGDKLVNYPSLTLRIYSMFFDITLVMFVLMPFYNLIINFFADQFNIIEASQKVILSNVMSGMSIPEALNDPRVVESNFMSNYLSLQIIIQSLIIILSIISVNICDYKFGFTPGKWLMKLRVVDEKTYQKPKPNQFILRGIGMFLNCLALFIPFFYAKFELRNRAFHDKFSQTLVVRLTKVRSKSL